MKLLTPLLISLALSPGVLSAATVANDAYDLTVSFEGDTLTSTETADGGVVTDVIGGLDAFEVSWVDGDSFFVSGRSTSTIQDLVFELTGLNFRDGANPADILNVVFDPAAGDFTGFVGYSSVIGPIIAFTTTSIKITLAEIPNAALAEQEFIDLGISQPGERVNIAADGVRFYFNVTALPGINPPTPVPLPASALLLAAALGGLAALRRRA